MDNKRIKYLYSRYLEKCLSQAELSELRSLLADKQYAQQFEMLLDDRWDEFKEETLLEVPEAIDNHLFNDVVANKQFREKLIIRLWPRIAVAVAVMVIVSGGWFFSTHYMNGSRNELGTGSPKYANDIKPGSNRAVLTLANGQKISLSDKKTGIVIDASSLKYNDGTNVSSLSTKKTGITNITTPRGGTYQITLPDGSMVWLNAASTLKFPSTFLGLVNRKVELTGEAYFQIAKDKKHPFIVKSRAQQVEVLGTHFNVNSYEDEDNVKTTLVEGVVEVSSKDIKSGLHYRLKPNQQSILTDKAIKVIEVDAEETIAWKNGKTQFSQQDIKSIMLLLSRWYNIEVKYEGPVPEGKFGGSVSRSKNISEILKVLELTGEVHFKIEGRRVTVTK